MWLATEATATAGEMLTKTDQIAWARGSKAPDDRTLKFEALRVRTYGNVGIVNGIVSAIGPSGGERLTIFTDVFVQRNGRWFAVNAQENRIEAQQVSAIGMTMRRPGVGQ